MAKFKQIAQKLAALSENIDSCRYDMRVRLNHVRSVIGEIEAEWGSALQQVEELQEQIQEFAVRADQAGDADAAKILRTVKAGGRFMQDEEGEWVLVSKTGRQLPITPYSFSILFEEVEGVCAEEGIAWSWGPKAPKELITAATKLSDKYTKIRAAIREIERTARGQYKQLAKGAEKVVAVMEED